MRPVVLSWHARADLREIAAFIAADDPARAARFVTELRARCQSLSHHPMQDRPAPEIDPELRILVFRAYLILHRVHDDTVRIDRVVHAARDLSALWPHD